MPNSFANILVFHPAAIGDAVLATPVATTLKLNYPGAKLTYWTHPSLHSLLLGLCPAIEEAIDYSRESSVFDLIKTFNSHRADLFIDLANSTKSRAIPWLSGVKVLRYQKQAAGERPIRHAVANFLDTIRPICDEIPTPLFPTIFPEAIADHVLESFWNEGDLPPLPMIGIVPGVGKLRPHRAWLRDCWSYLLQHVVSWQTHLPVLIGGEEEAELCAELAQEAEGKCLNTAGRLSLPETAAVLKRCKAVVSCDTGPAHLAVAVGTKVVGLYGPTFPQRSGPYGCLDLALDQSPACQCHAFKECRLVRSGDPGECMSRIMLDEIIRNLKLVLYPDAEQLSVLD